MGEPPKRIQRKRTKGWKMPPDTVCVDRSTRWGNPFRVGTDILLRYPDNSKVFLATIRTPQQSVEWYRAFTLHYHSGRSRLAGLRGKNLACWCKEGDPCHADVLLELANQ
jgi:hypothetical protein